jgi:hypothetical protein
MEIKIKGYRRFGEGQSTQRELGAVLPLTEQDVYRFNIFQTDSAGPHSLIFKGYGDLSPQG